MLDKVMDEELAKRNNFVIPKDLGTYRIQVSKSEFRIFIERLEYHFQETFSIEEKRFIYCNCGHLSDSNLSRLFKRILQHLRWEYGLPSVLLMIEMAYDIAATTPRIYITQGCED